jgi:hypothetical protein
MSCHSVTAGVKPGLRCDVPTTGVNRPYAHDAFLRSESGGTDTEGKASFFAVHGLIDLDGRLICAASPDQIPASQG